MTVTEEGEVRGLWGGDTPAEASRGGKTARQGSREGAFRAAGTGCSGDRAGSRLQAGAERAERDTAEGRK